MQRPLAGSTVVTRTRSPVRTRTPRDRSAAFRVASSWTIWPSTSSATSPQPFASNEVTARASSSIELSSVTAGLDSNRKRKRQIGPTSSASNAMAPRMAAPSRHGSPSGAARRPPAPKPTSTENRTRGERSDCSHEVP